MINIKRLIPVIFAGLMMYSCTKDTGGSGRAPDPPITFNYTFGLITTPGIPTKKLKIKVLDGTSNVSIKNAVFYVKAIGRKLNCFAACDSILYEDSVVTDAVGEAVIIKRGNVETLRDKKGYWNLFQLHKNYSFQDYDSTVFNLWPEVWVKIAVKNDNKYESSYLFSPRLESESLRVAYQALLTVNKDTTITERLWANQNYKVTLSLYKNQFGTLNGPPVSILKEFNQFIGRDTVELNLNY